jgi:hypothetical protein
VVAQNDTDYGSYGGMMDARDVHLMRRFLADGSLDDSSWRALSDNARGSIEECVEALALEAALKHSRGQWRAEGPGDVGGGEGSRARARGSHGQTSSTRDSNSTTNNSPTGAAADPYSLRPSDFSLGRGDPDWEDDDALSRAIEQSLQYK